MGDVSKVTDMRVMFWESTFKGDLSKWDVSNVANMHGMFSESSFNGDLSKWDVSRVTYMNSMFYYSKFTGDLSKWDVSQVAYMGLMFTGASCSLCDHVPHGLERACRSECHHPSPLDCVKAFSESECSVLTQCTWC